MVDAISAEKFPALMAALRATYGSPIQLHRLSRLQAPAATSFVSSAAVEGVPSIKRRLTSKTSLASARSTALAATVAATVAKKPRCDDSAAALKTTSAGADPNRLRVATINVDGCGALSYKGTPPSTRMKKLVEKILPLQVDAICFQEVTDELFEALRAQLPSWGTFRKKSGRGHYYVATFTKKKAGQGDITCKCISFEGISTQGRHVLVVRYGPLLLMNIHAESGMCKQDRANRKAQLERLAGLPEGEETTYSIASCISLVGW